MPTKGFTDPGSRRTSFYDPALSTTFLSNSVWRTAPLLEWLFDPSIGFMVNEDFNTYDATATTGDYLLTQATSGTGAIDTTFPGTLKIDAGATTQHQGANVQRLKQS